MFAVFIKISFALLISIIYAYGLGFFDAFNRPKEYLPYLAVTLLSTLFLCYLQNMRIIYRIIYAAIFLLLSLYIATGTGIQQGHMSLGIIASVFQSDQNEALEFLSVVHYKFIFYAVLSYVLLLVFLFYKQEDHVFQCNSKLHKIILAMALFLNATTVFALETTRAIYLYKKEEKFLNEYNQKDFDWKIKQVNVDYQTQVFIIGESVQRNYLSLYGYQYKTTPFLDQMPLTYIENYIAAAPNTAASLVRTLAVSDGQQMIQPAMNVVRLANQAGYNTIWISNQGFMGKNDTAVSKTAQHAQHKLFLKTGNYRSNNIDDDEMLPLLQQQLKKYPKQNNIIFIHMMGSHPDSCERLFNSPLLYTEHHKALSCYLSSIYKLDHFIEGVYEILKQQNRSFKIHYFSDHGMSVDEDSIVVDNQYKHNYQVPYIILSSDAKQKTKIAKTVSAQDFIDIFAAQIGVTTPYLKPNYTLEHIPDNPNVTVFNWDELIPYNQLLD
ncbi:phosphoethanolamine transferase [Acinetobacter larvae]|uniref:Sulfatase N-terminal domain-containing protein n=1 Tax=Acinetobacter larvae TaxID=1789224 RepID=A0A1B2LWZ0_9GAMM|nr:phosphoethanolamine transferase [Acinetobacter larvae]AOA57460.1 hypothetical protein BFG52_03225 [Acinetobacter larvae]